MWYNEVWSLFKWIKQRAIRKISKEIKYFIKQTSWVQT